MRYAIWTAVSTEAQAKDDKVSLTEQERLCAKVGNDKGWTDTSLRFVVPGESRTKWIDLSTAAAHIPALRQMMSAAENRQFELLIIYDYNRLRDLLSPISMFLGSFGIMLYSISQPVEPKQGVDDTHVIMEGMAGIFSKLQIFDLRRKYNYGMPARVTNKGIPAISIPYGYCKPPGHETDRNAVPIKDYRAALVVKMKDALLAGQSLRQIAKMLDNAGEPPPKSTHWQPGTIAHILRNPFYAGIVRWGTSRTHSDPRTGKRVRDYQKSDENVIYAQGKHQPLWDMDTNRAIQAEFKRRGHNYPGRRTSIFSRLLFCGVCGATLLVTYDGGWGAVAWDKRRMVYRCRAPGGSHTQISYEDTKKKVSALLVELMDKYPDDKPPPPQAAPPDYETEMEKLKARRRLTEDLYIKGGIAFDNFSKRVFDLDKQIAELVEAMEKQVDERADQKSKAEALGKVVGINWDKGNPQEINRMLHLFIGRIIVTPGGELRIELR